MTLHEYRVLAALNIASARHARPKYVCGRDSQGFEATAAQVAEVYQEQNPGPGFTAIEVGAALRELRRARGGREPMVERVGTRKWRMTSHGARVMVA